MYTNIFFILPNTDSHALKFVDQILKAEIKKWLQQYW